MRRLIDADELIKDIDYSADMGGALGKVVECVKHYAKYMVASAPTVEERKTGKWEIKDDPYGFFEEIPVCSECGHTTKMRETYAFCPNCGARMEA